MTSVDVDTMRSARVGALPSILILCYQFPPVNGTGARRPYYLARALADEGHRVGILTTEIGEAQPWLPNTSGIEVYRTPKTTVQRDLSGWQRWLAKLYWSHQGKPGHGLVRIVADLLLPEGHIDRWDILPEEVEQHLGRYDIVLATCPSWYPFRLAAKLADRWGALFVADYRDPWTLRIPTLHLQGFTQFGTGVSGWLRKRKMKRAERRWPGQAYALTAISAALLDNARLTTGVQRGAVFHGGFDPLLHPQPYVRREHFNIVYTGRVYAQQDWYGVMRALDLVRERDPSLAKQLCISLYGAVSESDVLLADLQAFGERTGMIRLLPRLGRDETMLAQQTADAVLHISPDDHQGGLPVKFLEYLGCGRPILLFIKKADLESKAVAATRTGAIANNVEALADILHHRAKQWQQGQVWTIEPNPTELQRFNYGRNMKAMAAQLRAWHAEFATK